MSGEIRNPAEEAAAREMAAKKQEAETEVANPVSLLDNVDEEGEPEKPFDLAELVQHLSVFLNGSSVETVSISRFEKMGGRLEDGEAQLVGTRGAVGEIFYRKGSDVHRVYISSKETKSLGFRGGHDRENAVLVTFLGILFFIVATINTHFISAIGKPKVVAKMILVAAVLNIIFDLLLVPFLGMNGAAIATAMSYTYVFISSTIVLSKILATKYPFALWMKQLIAAVIFIVVVSGIKELLSLSIWLELVASVLAAIVIYIIVAGLFGLIDMKEMKHYLSLMRK